MSLGSGIAFAGVWLAAAAVTCIAMVFRESDWMLGAAKTKKNKEPAGR